MNKAERITNLDANSQLLYFTSSSLLLDDSVLIYLSDRTGSPNIFSKHLVTGEEQQLTFNREGYLKSYVYFDGNENKGLGKASISLDPAKGKIYYIQGQKVCCTDLNGNQKVMASIPDDQITAFTHVSADGRKLCVPTTDARALEGNTQGKNDYDIDQRIQEENLNSYLRVYDTESGEEILTERVSKCWITHVQFSPIDSNLILYNHEWPSDCGIRRMWLWDGKTHVQLRTENEERSRKDWVCHEVWNKTGEDILYHGKFANQTCFVGNIHLATKEMIEISFPKEYQQYGHFTVSSSGLLVSDGYYQNPFENESRGFGKYISIQKVNWKLKTIEWIPLCEHGSNWDSQDSHPHPIFNHKSDVVFYTSNQEGKRAVYRINVPNDWKFATRKVLLK